MKKTLAFSFAVTVLLSTTTASVLSSPSKVGDSQDTPLDISIPHININSSFIELPELNLNSSEPLGNSSTPKPTEPTESSSTSPTTTSTSTTPTPTTTSTSTTTTTTPSTTTVRPESIVTVTAVPVASDKKPPAPVKEKVLNDSGASEESKTSVDHSVTSIQAHKASTEVLQSLVSQSSHRTKPLKPAAEETTIIKNQKGATVQEKQTFTGSNGKPIELSSSSFTSNEKPNVSSLTVDPEISSLLKEFERDTRTPETKLPNPPVQKDESSNKIVPIPVIAPHVLHVDPKSGQVFVQPIVNPQVAPVTVSSPLPEKISNNIPGGSGRWFWNLFKWGKKPTPEPTKRAPEENGIHIIKAKKNVKPGEPYYECPLVKASPPVTKPQQQRSYLFFL